MIPHLVLATALGLAGLVATAAAAALTASLVPRPVHVAAAVEVPVPTAAPARQPPATVRAPVVTPCPSVELTFAPSSTVVAAGAAQPVVELAGWLRAHPDVDVTVDGHSDARGRPEVNLWTSHERARSVEAVLVKEGVVRTRIHVRGFGTYQPVAGVAGTDPRQRRVVVSVTGSEVCP